MEEDILKRVKKLALEEAKKYGIPPRYHLLIGEVKVRELSKKVKANEKLALLGYYLMDIKLGEAFKKGKVNKHIKLALEFANNLLRGKLEEKEMDVVLNCIEAHHGDIPAKYPEAEVCKNADTYRFLHPFGLITAIYDLSKRGFSLKEILEILKRKIEEKEKIISMEFVKKELKGWSSIFKSILKNTESFLEKIEKWEQKN